MAQILVIDDDSALRKTVVKALRSVGHELEEAGTGREAMALLERIEPGLILTDINMPEMDGIEVVMAIREHKPGIPIVAMSGGGQFPKELLLMNAGALGAARTLSKPFELDELLHAVETALEEGAPLGD